MPAEYTVEVWGDSVRVRGPVPAHDLKAINMIAKTNGYDTIDLLLGKKYGVTLFITSKHLSAQLQKEFRRAELHGNGQ
jgi:hypothetical protein